MQSQIRVGVTVQAEVSPSRGLAGASHRSRRRPGQFDPARDAPARRLHHLPEGRRNFPQGAWQDEFPQIRINKPDQISLIPNNDIITIDYQIKEDFGFTNVELKYKTSNTIDGENSNEYNSIKLKFDKPVPLILVLDQRSHGRKRQFYAGYGMFNGYIP